MLENNLYVLVCLYTSNNGSFCLKGSSLLFYKDSY